MPKTTFVAGNILTANQVNEFLMDQSVMVFANSAARGSAIAVPSDGMVSHLQDTNVIEQYRSYGTAVAAWEPVSPGLGNKIINGDFDINQRVFTSTTTNATYGFDRWQVGVAGNGTTTYSAQTFTPGAAPVAGYEARNFARIVTTGQSTSAVSSLLTQPIEDVRTCAGSTVTVSFWAKAASGTPKIAVELGQNFGSGGSPSAAVLTYAGQVTISTSWARYYVSVAVPSITGKTIGTTANTSYVALNLWASAGSDLNARTGSLGIQSGTFDFWGVQLEQGAVVSPFATATGSKQGELSACQRYYFRSSSSASAPYAVFALSGYTKTTTSLDFNVQAPVTMRINPTSIDFANLALQDTAQTILNINSLTMGDQLTPTTFGVSAAVPAATAGRSIRILAPNSAAAFLGFSAEF
jgi:hypothetical protein